MVGIPDGDRNRNHWDSLGSRYSANWASPAQRELSEKETGFVLAHLPPGPALRVLDVGVGTGRILEKLFAEEQVAEVYGVDIAPHMVEVCQSRFAGNPKLKGLFVCDVDKEELPLSVGLQFISAIRVIKYSRNWWDIVEDKLMAHLAPGGVVVFSMPNSNSVKRLSRPYAVDYFQTTADTLRRRLASAGAQVLEISGFSKVPDVVYRKLRRPALTRSLLAVEHGLDDVLGPARLTRELFVAAQRAG